MGSRSEAGGEERLRRNSNPGEAGSGTQPGEGEETVIYVSKTEPDPPEENSEGKGRVDPAASGAVGARVPSGVAPLDERTGGLEQGGVYLIAGSPGPAKLVAVLQFLHAGLMAGERGLLLTSSRAPGILEVARAWGFDLDGAWRLGKLGILGFRDDFEMRVLRSADPQDALDELHALVGPDVARMAVEPGSAFFHGGTRTLLGRAFLEWARRHPATVWATLAIDGGDGLPASAEWLVHSTDGVFLVDQGSEGLYRVRVRNAYPTSNHEDPITLQLTPGQGLVAPDPVPTRRRSDRTAGDADRLLLVTLGEPAPGDLETWARGMFTTEVVANPLEAVSALQEGSGFGSVLVYCSRGHVMDAVRACRAMRPLTGSPILVAADDALRATDRVNMLEAGADDCMSGGVNVRELGTRIKQAVENGGKAAPKRKAAERQPEPAVGGVVDGEVFGAEVSRRSENTILGVFSVVRASAAGVATPELQDFLAEQIRDEEGDLVTAAGEACLVLLQGARSDQARSFVARVERRLKERQAGAGHLESEILAHPRDKKRIASAITETDESQGEKVNVGPGGSRDRKA